MTDTNIFQIKKPRYRKEIRVGGRAMLRFKYCDIEIHLTKPLPFFRKLFYTLIAGCDYVEGMDYINFMKKRIEWADSNNQMFISGCVITHNNDSESIQTCITFTNINDTDKYIFSEYVTDTKCR